MDDFHYLLDKNRQRVKTCPCGRSNLDGKFVPFVGYTDKGFCHSCGKTFLPKFGRSDAKLGFPVSDYLKKRKQETITEVPYTLFPKEIFCRNIATCNTDVFFQYIKLLFGNFIASQLVRKYCIGSNDYWDGGTLFWQLDIDNKVRTGKIIQYQIVKSKNALIGVECKRVKTNTPPVYWAHSYHKISGIKQCLFGEHLLGERNRDGSFRVVCVVESEKTATIASVYFPNYTWLAFGGKNFDESKLNPLRGRTVILWPDLNCYELWMQRARKLSKVANILVSDFLDKIGTESDREQGLDLVDYLIRYNPTDFQDGKDMAFSQLHDVGVVDSQKRPQDYTCCQKNSGKRNLEDWSRQIQDIEVFFEKNLMPQGRIMLNAFSTILDTNKFVDSHLSIIKAHNGNPVFRPYLTRLTQFKNLIQKTAYEK